MISGVLTNVSVDDAGVYASLFSVGTTSFKKATLTESGGVIPTAGVVESSAIVVHETSFRIVSC